MWVLSLPGHDAWYNQAFADVVTIVPPEQLAAKALEVRLDIFMFQSSADWVWSLGREALRA